MKIKYVTLILGSAILLAGIMGCAVGTTGGIEPFSIGDPDTSPVEDAEIYYPNNFKISITDAPPKRGFLDEVNITFSSIEVSRDFVFGDSSEWIPVNTDGGTFNLLELTNGTLQTLVLEELDPGQYNQIRFHVSDVIVVIGEDEHKVHLASNKFKIVKRFFIKEGLMTSLVLDFDVMRSLKRNKRGRWSMTPVTRCVQRYLTGAITGKIVSPTDVKATVTAYSYEKTDSQASTLTYYSGKFVLGYLEPGTYVVEIKAGDQDEYFLRVEDVEVEIGKIVNLGELTLLEANKSINTITVDVVDTIHPNINGSPVYVTIFTGGGKIPDDMFETVAGEIEDVSATVIMDNLGAGYPDDTYGIMVHIDFNRDGKLTAQLNKDYVAVGEVTVSGGSVNVEINGPWGTYFSLILVNADDVSPVTTGRIYLTLVSEGDTWGNYAYGENDFDSPLWYKGIDSWAPGDTYTYDFLAFIDTNDNMANTFGRPDPGDWVASRSIDVSGGSVTDPPMGIWFMTIDSWSEFQ